MPTRELRGMRDASYRRLREWLEGHWREDAVRATVDALRRQKTDDVAIGRMDGAALPAWGAAPDEAIRDAAVDCARAWMREERPLPAVQALYAAMWRDEAEGGRLTAAVYDDVPRSLKRWRDLGIAVGIYSIVPIEGQQAVLRHSRHGDLTALVDVWSDAAVGAPHDAATWIALAERLGVPVDRLRVACDEPHAGLAVENAGAQVVMMQRDGLHESGSHGYRVEVTLGAL